ncbi:MAG: hypothetical protein IT514_00535 [Burkholderiales bacterium]|nr:hypothetical protein [Burkholderiales bacterium]
MMTDYPMLHFTENNAKLWPFPMIDAVTRVSIVVDAAGRRFTDEGCGGILPANAMAQLLKPAGEVAKA